MIGSSSSSDSSDSHESQSLPEAAAPAAAPLSKMAKALKGTSSDSDEEEAVADDENEVKEEAVADDENEAAHQHAKIVAVPADAAARLKNATKEVPGPSALLKKENAIVPEHKKKKDEE